MCGFTKMIKLKYPKSRVKCFKCGKELNNNEINSNVGLLANSQERFYCDYCCGEDESQGIQDD